MPHIFTGENHRPTNSKDDGLRMLMFKHILFIKWEQYHK